ncbi:T9SS type A sorting domain-containing protein [Cytophagaceae bacterium ABcell3]|nr:T9SS type A sorting domain-containing protein [Cytophagaceae bacterium ABcell3]
MENLYNQCYLKVLAFIFLSVFFSGVEISAQQLTLPNQASLFYNNSRDGHQVVCSGPVELMATFRNDGGVLEDRSFRFWLSRNGQIINPMDHNIQISVESNKDVHSKQTREFVVYINMSMPSLQSNYGTYAVMAEYRYTGLDGRWYWQQATTNSININGFIRQQGTVLRETGEGWKFASGDYNNDGKVDIWAVNHKTGSGRTDLHIMDGASNFRRFNLQEVTILRETDGWDFQVGDYNRDGILDLYAIARRNGSGRTEVHVLDGRTRFKSFLLQRATIHRETNDDWHFLVGDYNNDGFNDLYAIATRRANGSTQAEIHILNGRDNFNSYLYQRQVPLRNAYEDFKFLLNIRGGRCRPDVVAIKKQNTGTRSTEVHVLSGESNYQGFKRQTGTGMGNRPNSDFVLGNLTADFTKDIIEVKTGRTGTRSTELHGIAGACYLDMRCSRGALTAREAQTEGEEDEENITNIDEGYENAFKLYPNPVQDVLHVMFSGASNSKSQINIYNMSGQKVRSMTLIEENSRIEVADLLGGVYIYEILSETGNKKGKFVKL